MKSQFLHTVWCNISGEAEGEIWHWSSCITRPLYYSRTCARTPSACRLDWVNLTVHPAYSIKCYECYDCCDRKGREKECASGFDQCAKSFTTISGKDVIDRACANRDSCEANIDSCNEQRKRDKDVLCESACCDDDLCNVGAVPSFSILVLSLCSLVAVVPFLKWERAVQKTNGTGVRFAVFSRSVFNVLYSIHFRPRFSPSSCACTF